MHANPKQSKRVQTDCDTNVVDDTAPEIAGFSSNISLLIGTCSLHDDGRDSQDGLEPCILKDAPLDS